MPSLNEPPFEKKPQPGATNQKVMADTDQTEETPASKEEQALYDELMEYAYEIMAEEGGFGRLQKMLEQNPEQAIVDATLTIIERIEKDKGQQDTDMLQALAEEIIPNLAELAEEMGVDIPEDRLEQITAEAIGQWAKAHPDRIDQQTMGDIGTASTAALQQTAGGSPNVAG